MPNFKLLGTNYSQNASISFADLANNQSNFLSLPWKLDNPYCHIVDVIKRKFSFPINRWNCQFVKLYREELEIIILFSLLQLHQKLVMKEKSVTIGVLSIQGSFAEHICALQKLDNVIARGHSITTRTKF